MAPLQKIKTVPYKAWQVSSFSISRVFKKKIIEMLKDRISREVLERNDSPYRNP